MPPPAQTSIRFDRLVGDLPVSIRWRNDRLALAGSSLVPVPGKLAVLASPALADWGRPQLCSTVACLNLQPAIRTTTSHSRSTWPVQQAHRVGKKENRKEQ